MSNKVFIISGCRTPIGNFQGQYRTISAIELGAISIIEALKRANLQSDNVDEVIIGQALTAGLGQNPARQSAVQAKIPYETPAYTVNMLCGSGLKTVYLAYQSIKSGDASIVVAGGQENMSKAPHVTYIRGLRYGKSDFLDTVEIDGLTDSFHKVSMGKTAEHLAEKYQISRQRQDEFALTSQLRTKIALENNYFTDEIVPVPGKKGVSIDKDEFPKPDTTLEKLEKLPTVFQQPGSVTAGNASGINDGAAILVVASENAVKSKGLVPIAEIIAFAENGGDPLEMGIAPIGAISKLLTKCGWTKDDVDLFELNEAFAVQSIIIIDKLGLDKDKVNVTGGAIALGHPIGASGARVLVTLISNLKRLGKKRGVAALCIGGGMAIAIAIEMQ